MPDDKKILPGKLAEQIASTPSGPDDEIAHLQGQLSTAQDGLRSAEEEVKNLKFEVERLSDDSEIKEKALKYAYWFLIFVPISCLLILIFASNEGLLISIKSFDLYVMWKMKINDYAMATLIVAPIAFVGAILGFLIRGVLGGKPDTGGIGLQDLTKFLSSGGK